MAKHELNMHFYADDTQSYTSTSALKADDAVPKFMNAMEDIAKWMGGSRLKLNTDKAQFIWVETRQQLDKVKIKSMRILGVDVH